MKNKIARIVAGVYTALWSPARILEHLVSSMALYGWHTIYFNDDDAGDEALKSYGMEKYMHQFPAFTFACRAEKVIALDSKASDKLHLFAHEMGHISLGHDLFAPTPYDEVEADQFSAQLIQAIETGQESFEMILEGLQGSYKKQPCAACKP